MEFAFLNVKGASVVIEYGKVGAPGGDWLPPRAREHCVDWSLQYALTLDGNGSNFSMNTKVF